MTARLIDLAGVPVGTFKLLGFSKSEPPRLLVCATDSAYYTFLLHTQRAGGMDLEYRRDGGVPLP